MIRKAIKKGLKLSLKIGSVTRRKAKKVAKLVLGRKVNKKEIEAMAKNVMSASMKEQSRLRKIMEKEIKKSIDNIASTTKKKRR